METHSVKRVSPHRQQRDFCVSMIGCGALRRNIQRDCCTDCSRTKKSEEPRSGARNGPREKENEDNKHSSAGEFAPQWTNERRIQQQPPTTSETNCDNRSVLQRRSAEEENAKKTDYRASLWRVSCNSPDRLPAAMMHPLHDESAAAQPQRRPARAQQPPSHPET